MSIRTDITVDFEVSPRIATIALPSVALNVQDLHDTLVGIGDSIEGGQHPGLIKTAGKEPLGASVFVGLTATLQDCQVAFEARTTPLENSTATANDLDGEALTDAAGAYVTNLVGRGDIVFNVTDNSAGTVVNVIDENNLIMTALTGGADNEWAVNDIYLIYDEVQCEISGGNLVAIDAVGSAIDAVFPTFGTQIVRTSSASATLQELADIQYSSFGGGVTVDFSNITGNAIAGTTYPTGTPRQPCTNLTDALVIAGVRGFTRFFIVGDITIPTGPVFDNKIFEGESENRSLITIPAAATANNCEYEEATITGTLDGESTIKHCAINTLAFVNGIILNSGFEDATITLGGGAQASIIDCHSLVAGTGTPTIDMGGSGQALIMRNYSGGIELINKTGSDAVSIDMQSGQIVLDTTVDGTGAIMLRGNAKWTNEDTYTGSAPVTNQLLEGADLREIWKLLGLDPNDKITITPTGVSTQQASFVLTFTGDGVTSTTMERTA